MMKPVGMEEKLVMEKINFEHFQWLNESDIRFDDGKMIMYAPSHSDFFCSHKVASQDGAPESRTNAPFLFTEVTGDFVMKVKVELEFKDVYDSATIMVMENLQVWAKLCFEYTEFNTHAVVSVVTNGMSDDANGNNVEGNELWLQMTRVGQSFAFHYSVDGKRYEMVRYFHLPVGDKVKVGFVPQAPSGEGGDRIYSQFSLESKTVNNIRIGQ
jgi:regulation of enolase protein 1 (concanavalin A-like superfamily)